MKKALIFENRIVQVEPVAFLVHPALVWVDAPDNATPETHVYAGGIVAPKPPKTPAELAADDRAAVSRELAALDLASIRDLRAWVAAQPTAPQTLKDREAAAVAARARLV